MVQQSNSSKQKDPAQELYEKSSAGKEVKKEYDRFALMSFLLVVFAFFSGFFLVVPFIGLIMFIFSPFLFLLSIVFGMIGLHRIKKNNTYGRGYAIAGIIISCFALIFGLMLLLLFAYIVALFPAY